jgi:hypothetical protein
MSSWWTRSEQANHSPSLRIETDFPEPCEMTRKVSVKHLGSYRTHLAWFPDRAWFACPQGEGTGSQLLLKVLLNESEQRTLKSKKNNPKSKKEMKSQQVYVKTDQLERFSIWDRVRTNIAF